MDITSAKYVKGRDGNNSAIIATIDGVSMEVPLDPANRHYAEINRQVGEGSLTRAEAD